MKIKNFFPPPEQANIDGIVAIGGGFSVEMLFSAYSQGIFPWPHEGLPLLWFCPWERGILEFKDFHVSQSLKKFVKKQNWQFTLNLDFTRVISECSRVKRPGQGSTWINSDMIKGYKKFHDEGFAHSLEVWEGDELIGGIYGVFVKNVFSAESMFYKKPNASKWALWCLVNYLQQMGLNWMDVQMVTPITKSFGAHLISQKEFIIKLKESQKKDALNGFSKSTSPS